MTFLFGFNTEPPAAPAETWAFGQKGDAAGSGVENSSTSVTLTAIGSSDEANIDFAHQSIASGDVELSGIIPAQSSWSGNLVNWAGFGIGITEGTGDSEYFFQLWLPNIGTARNKYGTPPSYTTQVGISDQTPPLYFKATYDDTLKELKAWTSVDGVDYFQLGSTVSHTMSYPFIIYGFATSADPVASTTATITGLLFATSITVTEAADPGNRVGIIAELSLTTDDFGPLGAVVDGMWYRDRNTSDVLKNSFQAADTFESDWLSKPVDSFADYGIHGLVNDRAYRFRIGYDYDYTTSLGLGQIRSTFWWPGAASTNRLAHDTEYWFCYPLMLPSDHESDGEFGRETLYQLHNDSQAAGVFAIVIDQGTLKVLLRTTDTSTTGGTETTLFSQSVSTDLGETTLIIFNFRLNPYSVETVVPSSAGAKAQVGVTYPANTGMMRIFKTIANGASCTSDDLGTVTNSTGDRTELPVASLVNTPVGRVPDFRGGITDENSLVSIFDCYKSGWFNGEYFIDRPTIPHAKSTKEGPIDILLDLPAYFGDSSCNYGSIHPVLGSVEPT